MKNQFLRFFSLLCAAVLLVLSAGCNETDDVWSEWIDLVEVSDDDSSEELDSSDATSAENSDSSSKNNSTSSSKGNVGSVIHITSGNRSNYKIVVSLSNEGYDEGRLLQKVIKSTSNASVPIILDTENSTGAEIIIGDTTRTESQSLIKSLGDNDIAMKAYSNGNIAIVGSNATALTMAVEKFLKNYFGYAQNATTVGKEVGIPTNLNIIQSAVSEYKLVWSDEFEGSNVNTSKWGFKAFMTEQPHMRLYSDEKAVKVENGCMNLIAGRLSDTEYYSNTSLTTADTMVFKYGYLEMRAKVPFGKPSHPSFWTQSSMHGAEDPYVMGEIDIFEHFATKLPYIQSGIHKWYRDGTGEHYISKQIGRNVFESEQLAEDWHTYALWWTPQTLNFLVDSKVYHIIDISDETGDFGDRNDGMQCFRDYQHIIFNNYLMTEGMKGQDSNTSADVVANPNDKFPIVYSIDYVRLYQLPGEGKIMNLKQ